MGAVHRGASIDAACGQSVLCSLYSWVTHEMTCIHQGGYIERESERVQSTVALQTLSP